MPSSRAGASQDALPRSLWWLLAGLSLVWGFNWPVMKVVLSEVPPWTFRGLCMISAIATLLPIARATGQRVLPARGDWAPIALVALFSVTLNNVTLMLGVPLLPAGRTVVLYYTMPVWSVLLAAWALAEPLTRRRVVGVAAGAGAVALIAARDLAQADGVSEGAIYILLASLAWALGTVLQKRVRVSLRSTALAGWMMVLGGIPIWALAIGLESDRFAALGEVSFRPAAGVLYNMLACFVFGWWAWIRIVERASAGAASVSSLAIPVIGVAAGMLMLGERPAWQDWAALALVLVAIGTLFAPASRVR